MKSNLGTTTKYFIILTMLSGLLLQSLPLVSFAATADVTGRDIDDFVWSKAKFPGVFGLKNVRMNTKKVNVGGELTISWDYKVKPDPERYDIQIKVSDKEGGLGVDIGPYPKLSPDVKSFTWKNIEPYHWQQSKDRYITVLIVDQISSSRSIVGAVTSKKVTLSQKKISASDLKLILPSGNVAYSQAVPLSIKLTHPKMNKDWLFEMALIRPDGTKELMGNYSANPVMGPNAWYLDSNITHCYTGLCTGYGVWTKLGMGSLNPVEVSFKNAFSLIAQ